MSVAESVLSTGSNLTLATVADLHARIKFKAVDSYSMIAEHIPQTSSNFAHAMAEDRKAAMLFVEDSAKTSDLMQFGKIQGHLEGELSSKERISLICRL